MKPEVHFALVHLGRATEGVPLDRSPADYAIEHAGYLADAAAAYVAEVNKVCVHLAQTTVDFSGLTDCHRALQSAIYEFRKRAERAKGAA